MVMQFMIKKHILCDHCRGSGAASDRDIHTCSGCGGSGVKLVKQQVLLTATRDGTGSSCAQRFSLGCLPKVRLHVTSVVAVAKLSPKSAHTAMEARSVPAILRVESLMLIPLFLQVVDHTAHYTLEILPGMPEGHEVVFEGESDESPDWEAGDVILRIRSRKNKGGWRRKESSLYWRETIGVDEVRTLQVPVFRTDLSFLFTGLTRFRPQFDPFRWTRSETSTEGCYSTRYVIKHSPFSICNADIQDSYKP
jgi:DnaJ-related protein SCJ1